MAGGLFIAVLLVILGALAAQAVTGSVTGWMLRPWWHLAGAGAGLWAAATAILLWDLARP